MTFTGVALGVLAALDPTTVREGVWAWLFFGSLASGLVLAVVLWVRGDRWPDWAMSGALAVMDTIVLLTVIANQSRNGALLNIVLLLPPLLFAAVYLSQRAIRVQEGLTGLSCAIAMAYVASDVVQWLSLMFVPILGLIGATEVVLSLRKGLDTAMRTLTELSVTDPLTGLLNRRGLHTRLDQTRQPLHCALVIDVDHFKQLNDNFGHAAGDDALRAVADALRSVAGNADLLVRLGGEEFLLLCGAGIDELPARSDEVRQSAQVELLSWGSTVSIGAVHTPTAITSNTVGAVIAPADAHLYTAKQTGRNRVVLGAHPPPQ